MKSIMQEASSLAKAIEQGWIKAGKPQEFTVKIFEHPKKNFFGFTVKSAKVGIFFNEAVGHQARPTARQQNQEAPRRQERQHPEIKKNNSPQARPLRDDRQPQRVMTNLPERQSRAQEHQEGMGSQEIWTDELVQEAKLWLNGTIKELNLNATGFETVVDQSHLTIVFNKPLSSDNQQEKIVFRSLSFLMMQSLRHTFKRRLKRLKITARSTGL